MVNIKHSSTLLGVMFVIITMKSRIVTPMVVIRKSFLFSKLIFHVALPFCNPLQSMRKTNGFSITMGFQYDKYPLNSSPPGQNGRYFADDIFRCIFMNEKFCILIKISLKFVPMGPIDNNPALALIMAWRRIGDKPLSQPMSTRLADAYMRH